MPPGKGGNAKKESGRAKKAENEAKKQEAAAAQKVSAEFHIDYSRFIKHDMCLGARRRG